MGLFTYTLPYYIGVILRNPWGGWKGVLLQLPHGVLSQELCVVPLQEWRLLPTSGLVISPKNRYANLSHCLTGISGGDGEISISFLCLWHLDLDLIALTSFFQSVELLFQVVETSWLVLPL